MQTVAVDGHRLTLTNLDKVLYPETGTTKADVIDYYARVAPRADPARGRTGRPRASAGSTASDRRRARRVFFQKNLDARHPTGCSRADHAHGPRPTTIRW